MTIIAIAVFFNHFVVHFQHPYLAPPSFVMANDQGSITVRNFFPNGTLRDCLCRVRLLGHTVILRTGQYHLVIVRYSVTQAVQHGVQ